MPAATRLFDFYSTAIGFGLAVDAQDASLRASAGTSATGAETQLRMRRLIERGNVQARLHGHAAHDIHLAAFALAAWFDEIAARRTDWLDAVAPLQLVLFNSTNAGTEFFHQLGSLQAEQSQLREIYWYLLALGFKGQYYFERDTSAGELASLRHLHAQQLPQAPVALHGINTSLCPPLYATPESAPVPAPARSRTPVRLGLVVATLVLLMTAWGLDRMHGPRHVPDSIAARIDRQLQRHTCAALEVRQGSDGILRVTGHVPSSEDMDTIRQEVRLLAGAQPSDVHLQWRPWPYCEVVDILAPHHRRNGQLRQGLRLSAPGAQGGMLREGDSVVLHVQAPAREGLMWVDYYTADGAVLHLRSQGQHRVPFTAGQHLVFGEDVPASWLVAPPFGPVLVTVIAQQRALSAPEPQPKSPQQPQTEPYELASTYLLRLRGMLSQNATDAPPLADALFLSTRER